MKAGGGPKLRSIVDIKRGKEGRRLVEGRQLEGDESEGEDDYVNLSSGLSPNNANHWQCMKNHLLNYKIKGKLPPTREMRENQRNLARSFNRVLL